MKSIEAQNLGEVFNYIKHNTDDDSYSKIADTLYALHSKEELDETGLFYDERKLAGYLCDKQKINDVLINDLHKAYNINPDYIHGKSNCMFDIMSDAFKAFEKIVSDWSTVSNVSDKNPDHHNEYLILTLSSAFYDFLLAVSKADLFPEVWTKEKMSEISELTQKYNPPYLSKIFKEFVLVPRNEFTEILSDYMDRRKKLSEVLNLEDHIDYPEHE